MIYVLSDIHGNKPAFDSVMKQIDLQPNDQLYVIGDVIDRGPNGVEILKQLFSMENATVLLGNHELMMLHTLSDEYYLEESYSTRTQSLFLYLFYLFSLTSIVTLHYTNKNLIYKY